MKKDLTGWLQPIKWRRGMLMFTSHSRDRFLINVGIRYVARRNVDDDVLHSRRHQWYENTMISPLLRLTKKP